MQILIVNGSPHTDGLCYKLLSKVAEGARGANVDIEFVQLAEMNIGTCRACSPAPCWSAMECNLKDDALKVRRLFNECDAFAFAAPVYFLSINGLAKNFIDRMRYYRKDTRPSLSLAVAGGTGKGCIMALNEICRWMILVGFAPIIAEPVTRYNFDVAHKLARKWGELLVKSVNKTPKLTTLHEKLLYFEKLPYARYAITDEMIYLAKSAVEAVVHKGKAEEVADLRIEISKAESRLKLGLWEEAFKIAVKVQEESMDLFNKIAR